MNVALKHYEECVIFDKIHQLNCSPQYGGKPCLGESVQAEICNLQVSSISMLVNQVCYALLCKYILHNVI